MSEAQPASQPAPGMCAHPWSPDAGDGTYLNPVIFADYSDPDVVRHGDDFYLVASSFNHTPGLPVLRSRDLVNWTIVAHALENLPDPRYAKVQHGCGVWAPCIREHAGTFYLFFPTPDEGIYVVTAAAPAGPWSKPHLVQGGKGLIDPSPLWDDDGKAYLVFAYARSRAGIKDRLHVRPMEPDASELTGDGKIVFHEAERHPTLEGPKFHKRNGWYYISAPAGGVGAGWQLILRSRNVYGPYEEKIVLAQRGTPTNGPHQGALVDTPGGAWWFVHFQERLPYGRITHLQPVTWKDDWPLIGVEQDEAGVGMPVARHRKPKIDVAGKVTNPATSDEFDGTSLGLQWQWQANHEDAWASVTDRPGHLRLHAMPVAVEKPAGAPDLASVPSLLGQKYPAESFRAETAVELTPMPHPGTRAGLVVMGEPYISVGLRHAAGGTDVVLSVNGTESTLRNAWTGPLLVAVDVAPGGRCTLSFAAPGAKFETAWAGQVDSRKGSWVGARVGVYCIADRATIGQDHADFDYFRFS